MDFLNGGELFFHLRKETKFSERRACFYAAQLVEAIRCLHQNGVIYRDLKPENVLLDQDGNLKITDFGLSKQGVETNKEGVKTYSFCGTPEYLAPEIIQGIGHDKGVDWWSLVSLKFLLKYLRALSCTRCFAVDLHTTNLKTENKCYVTQSKSQQR